MRTALIPRCCCGCYRAALTKPRPFRLLALPCQHGAGGPRSCEGRTRAAEPQRPRGRPTPCAEVLGNTTGVGGGWLGAGSDCGEQSQRASLPYVPLSSLFSLFCPVIKLSAHTFYLSSPSPLKAYVSPGLCGAALPTGIGQGRRL